MPPAGGLAAAGDGRPGRDIAERIQDRRQAVRDEGLVRSRQQSVEDIDGGRRGGGRFGGAGKHGPDFDPLFDRGDEEGATASCRKGGGNLPRTEAVGVGFHRRTEVGTRAQPLTQQLPVGNHGTEIDGQDRRGMISNRSHGRP